MAKWAKKFTLLAILFYPLDTFKLAMLPGLSLYRIMLIMATVTAFMSFFRQGRVSIPKKIVIPYIILSVVSAIVSAVISSEPAYANSAMLNEISGVILILLIVILFKYDDVDILLKQYVRSAYWGIPFAVFSWFVLFQNPGEAEIICQFGGLVKMDITEEFITSCYHMRLMLPYSSSSVYSGVLATTIAILVCDNSMYKPVQRYLLIMVFSLLLVMTQARTGLFALAVLLFIYILRMKDKNRKTKMLLLGGCAIICVVLFVSTDEEFVRKFLARFSNNDSDASIFEDRHFLVPLEGIRIWLTDVKNFLVGIGYGSAINIQGKWTVIPYFFFNSYITQIVAKGLAGVWIVAMWIKTRMKMGRLFRKNEGYSGRNKANAAYTVLLVACLTYEYYPYYAFFIIFAIVLICVNQGKN